MFEQVCRQCGHCCRTTIVEINYLDVLREPKLRKYLPKIPQSEITDDTVGVIAKKDLHGCPFLTLRGKCSIYRTRPNICVSFEPGSRQCAFPKQEKK
jgi:Fe-S-cluster containining protein